MKLTIKPVPSTSSQNCAIHSIAAHKADIEVVVKLRLSVAHNHHLASGRIYLCYNCLNTALVDALGHSISTEFDSLGTASKVATLP